MRFSAARAKATSRLTHRGGVNADSATGDGAGLITQIPRRFFRREMAKQGVNLGESDRFGVGMIFLPRGDAAGREKFIEITRQVLEQHGLPLLGHREAPTDWDVLGQMARTTLPWVEQVVRSKGGGPVEDGMIAVACQGGEAGERSVYVHGRSDDSMGRPA